MTSALHRPRALINSQGYVIPDSFDSEAFRGEYDGSDNLIYAGFARPGSGEGSEFWQIFKMSYTGANLTSITWPLDSDGNPSMDYQFSWTARASYTYV